MLKIRLITLDMIDSKDFCRCYGIPGYPRWTKGRVFIKMVVCLFAEDSNWLKRRSRFYI